MRCLYCGKELALLKRWTGGGEFCSDAHRQRYQEEYNQLALNRLLQAKPPAEAQPEASKPAPPVQPPDRASTKAASRPKEPEAAPSSVAIAISEIPRPAPIEILQAAPVYVSAEATPEEQPDQKAPAKMAGYLVELPVSALAGAAAFSNPDLEFLAAAAGAELPHRPAEAAGTEQETRYLEFGGLLSIPVSNVVLSCAPGGSRERRLEIREFPRHAPVVEFELSPAGETGLEAWSEAVDFAMTAQDPAGAPALWQELPCDFAPCAAELGDLGRLAFAATGFSAEAAEGSVTTAAEEPPSQLEVAAPEQPVAPEPIARGTVLDRSYFDSLSSPVTPAAVPVEQEPEPPVEDRNVEPAESPVAQAPADEAPLPVEEPQPPVPAAVTAARAVTVNAAAPGKGKPLQVFSSAPYGVPAQVPRSTSLPLRPVMTFGPVALPEPAKEAPQQAEPVSEKKGPERAAPAVPTFRPLAAEAPFKPIAKPGPAPAAKTSGPAKQDRKQAAKPEPRETKGKEEAKPAPVAEPPLPAPLAPPYPGLASDLGLPRLSLQPPQGPWGRMPLAVKIAVVAVMLTVVGAVIALSSKGGSASSSIGREPMVVPGSALPVGDGWIADWGADPGVRRTRQISVLRSSQTYSDYRLEMEGQIETKAIGWIFRAADPKNFYVTKLEIVKPGLEPTIALVRFAVINGEEQVRAQIPVALKVRRDTVFKIRFDAVGSRFTTYLQGEKIDEWTDDRVKTGGVGLYNERGEAASLSGSISVVPLVVRK